MGVGLRVRVSVLDVDHADEAEAREESAQPAVRPLSHLVRVRGAGEG